MRLARTSGDCDPLVSRFINVQGLRLHFVEQGKGPPVVLLHGNGSMVSDFLSSRVVERIVPNHRVIAFDRPGFGQSERPRHQKWGPFEQAQLLLRAFEALDIERPVLVGHSWGTLVALAAAMEAQDDIAGLVLLSGYYYPEPWRDETRESRRKALATSALPFADEMIREMVMPFVNRLMAPGAVRRIFEPCPVPDRFRDTYSISHAVRPSQIRAVIEEADMLMDSARQLSELYQELELPVRLLAGSDDKIVPTFKHSARLHKELSSSALHTIDGIGHMVHHSAPSEVAAAIEDVTRLQSGKASGRTSSPLAVERNWLRL